METPADDALAEFVAVMRRLRAECPWKQEQTHRSLARYLLEETHETLEAIDIGDRTGDWAHLREELGDLLLQVVFHAVIAEQAGEFDLGDVARDITAKMRRRNPHVYGPDAGSADTPPDAASVTEVWESIKATEKKRDRITDGLPPGLPALLYADKVLDRLGRADSEALVSRLASLAPQPAAREPVVPRPAASEPVVPGSAASEPVAPRPAASEPVVPGSAASEPVAPRSAASDVIGDRLLAVVAEARASGVDPEQALRDAVRRLL